MPQKKKKDHPLDEKTKAIYRNLLKQWEQEWPKEEFDSFKALWLAKCALKRDFTKYVDRPQAYAKEVLKVKWLPKQIEIAEAVKNNKRVLVRACHKYSSTHTAGGLINWFFDTKIPSVVLTVSPITDVLWKEVAVQRRGRAGLSPRAPRMEISPEHYARGYTIKDDSQFSGHAGKNMLIVFDNAQAVPEEFWQAAKTMATGENHRIVAFFNPTDKNCTAYGEEVNLDSGWHTIHLDARDHPNIIKADEPLAVDSGLTLEWFKQALKDWAIKLGETDEIKPERDFEWPLGSGQWYKPSADFESSVLGRWPTAKDSYFLSPTSQTEVTEGLDIDFSTDIAQKLERIKNIVGDQLL